MPKFEWKVEAVKTLRDLESFAYQLERKLNELEMEGFEVQRMELKDQGILLTGRRPVRPKASG